MIVAQTADLHARGQDLDAFSRQWKKCLSEAQAAGASCLTIAGDIYEKANVFDRQASTGAIVEAVMRPLAKSGLPTLAIPGNHDAGGGTSRDALSTIEGLSNVQVVRKADCVPFQGLWVACLPWLWDKTARETLEYFNTVAGEDPFDLLLAHVQVTGAYMSAGHHCEGGRFALTPGELADLDCSRYALGDFHRRQEIVEGKGGYIGALRQLNFGEEGNPMGFELWDTETNEAEWVELSEAPKYTTVEWEEGESRPETSGNTRVKTSGWRPDHEDVKALEDAGMELNVELPKTERTARVEVQDEDLQRPHRLLDLWGESQSEPPVMQPLHDTLDELLEES